MENKTETYGERNIGPLNREGKTAGHSPSIKFHGVHNNQKRRNQNRNV